MNITSIPVSTAPNISSASIVGNASSQASSAASGLGQGLPIAKLPTVPSVPSMPTASGGLTSLTRGALPAPKLGLDGLKSSVMGSVNIDSLIGDMKPSLAGKATEELSKTLLH